jgi:hypothetical protein
MLKQGHLVYILIFAVLICSIIQLLYGAFTVGFLANLLKIPVSKLVPSVIVICSIGAYVVRGLNFDVFLFAGAGLVAYFLLRLRFNLTAIVLGMILGRITESALIEGLTIASAKGGLLPYILSRPIAAVMLIIIVLYLCYTLLRAFFDWKIRQKTDETLRVTAEGASWKGIRIYDAVFSPLFIIGCASLFYMTYEFPGRSGLFPRFVLGVLMVCILFTFIKSLFMGRTYPSGARDPFADVRWGKLGLAVAIWILYLLIMNLVGFFIGSLVFVFVASMYFFMLEYPGKTTIKTNLGNALFSILFTIIIYLVFNQMFQIQLPSNITP